MPVERQPHSLHSIEAVGGTGYDAWEQGVYINRVADYG